MTVHAALHSKPHQMCLGLARDMLFTLRSVCKQRTLIEREMDDGVRLRGRGREGRR